MLRFFVLYAAIALPHDTQPSARLVGQRAFVLSPGSEGVDVELEFSFGGTFSTHVIQREHVP